MTESRSRQSGLSLPEILIVSLLFLIAVALIGALFSTATRSSRTGVARADLATKRAELASRLRRALMASSQAGNSVFYSTPAKKDDLVLSLISQNRADGTRDWDAVQQRPNFHGYEVFYRDRRDDSLRWLRVERSPNVIAEPLEEATLRDRLFQLDRTLANNITHFQLYSLQDQTVRDQWANPLGIRIVQQTANLTPVTLELSFRFVMP